MARHAMYLFTDSKVALREAVCWPSERLSSWQLLKGNARDKDLAKHARALPEAPAAHVGNRDSGIRKRTWL